MDGEKQMKRAILLIGILTCTSVNSNPQDLTCSEAADKAKKTESISGQSSVTYENFLRPIHHSDRSHSLKSVALAETRFYNYPSSDIASYEYTLDMLAAVLENVSNYIDNGESTIKFTREMADSIYQMGISEFPKFSYEQMEQGVALSARHAKEIKVKSNFYYEELSNQMTNFMAKIIRNDKTGLSMVFLWAESCNVDADPISAVYPVNNQNVKFRKMCIEGGDINTIAITPMTQNGLDFVVSEFKKRRWVEIPVKVEYDNRRYPVKFWANGFTKTWNAAGGDAL